MGFYADAIDISFRIPAGRVAAALVAIRASFGDEYLTLAEAVEDLTSFQECTEDLVDGFALGYHVDKFLSYTEDGDVFEYLTKTPPIGVTSGV